MTYSPTVRRRRLSRRLVQLREASGMDGAEVADRLGWSKSKISWIENDGWRRPNPRDVIDLLDIYQVTDPAIRRELAELARQARGKGWWAEYKDVFVGPLVELEMEATAIRTYEESVVPGLLQTPDYASALFRGGRRDKVERRVAARMRRQQILDRIHLRAVIDEAALRRQIASPDVMRTQFKHLALMSERQNVSLKVLTLSVGAHGATGHAFAILDFEDDPSIVYLDTQTGPLLREGAEHVSAYAVIYDHAETLALGVEESRRMFVDLSNGEGTQ